MELVRTRAELAGLRAVGATTVGLVPTMGALHEGHLSLVRRARAECDQVIVSVFVNPAQFGPEEDFAAYPRDLPGDAELLAAAGADVLWAPTESDIYPPGFATHVVVDTVTDVLEGARRPGHFAGVTTVVAVLFGVTRPTRAYFGQKDAQQTVVIRRMVDDLALPVQVVVCPTVREADGLAMSSRNAYLTPEERAAAPVLHRALLAAVQAAGADPAGDAEPLRQLVRRTVATEPLVELDYASVADPGSLVELTTLDPARGALVSLAARLGHTRLIDNVLVEPGPGSGR